VSNRRTIAGVLFVVALVGFVGFALWPRSGRAPRGNALTVVNAGTSGLDSVIVAADPPGANRLTGRIGYVAPADSAQLLLPAGEGDADVRAWRDGRVVAAHVAQFGGRSWFEVRVGDADDLGRYRRVR
jgi:hypothetical protein